MKKDMGCVTDENCVPWNTAEVTCTSFPCVQLLAFSSALSFVEPPALPLPLLLPNPPAGASRFTELVLKLLESAAEALLEPTEKDQLRLARLLMPSKPALIPGRSRLFGRLVEYPVKSPAEMETLSYSAPDPEGRWVQLLPTAAAAALVPMLVTVLVLVLVSVRISRVCREKVSCGQLCVPTEHISLSGTSAHTWLVWRDRRIRRIRHLKKRFE